jgi:hypothetical protein
VPIDEEGALNELFAAEQQKQKAYGITKRSHLFILLLWY